MTVRNEAAEGENSENDNEVTGGTPLARMIAERHALFDDVTTVMRDEDDLPVERGASGANLRWSEALGDARLDRRVRHAVWRLQKKHPNSDLDAEEVAQRIRQRLYNGAVNFRSHNGLAPDAPLRFKAGNDDWDKYISAIIKNECARYADRMEREAMAARQLVSRDNRDEKDTDGDEVHWRETLDFSAAKEVYIHDVRQMDVEAAISRLTGLSRTLIEAYYRDGLGQRTLAQRLGLALSSFQHGPWTRAKADFIKVWREELSLHLTSNL